MDGTSLPLMYFGIGKWYACELGVFFLVFYIELQLVSFFYRDTRPVPLGVANDDNNWF